MSAPVPLVTCVHTRGAVAGLRALGVAGPGPIAVGPGWTAAGLWSRYTRRRAAGADPIEAPVEFVRRVGEAASGLPEVVIYPGQEESLDALLAHEKLLPAHARLPYPPGAGADLRNKASLARLAEAAGFNPPRTLYDGPAGGLAAAGLTPPFVVKPLMKASGFGPAAVIETAGDLEHATQGLAADEPLLAQEHLVGDLVAVSLVTGPGGSTVARFQQRALRTWPPDAGPSSVAVSVAPDEELISRSAALLGDAGYWGLAELQFLVTESGMRGPIDVNPRFFGSLPLALAAGVNLPAAWHAVATGQPAPTPAGYREGVTYRWFEAELLAAIHGSPRVLLGRPRRPRVGAMWSAADPVPGVLLGGRALAEWLARRVRRANAA